MTHTLETLLPLLDKDGNPINQEASDKLRVWAAELDGLTKGYINGHSPKDCLLLGGFHSCFCQDFPRYPTSLDAIYAAEKRAGIHDPANRDLRHFWIEQAGRMIGKTWWENYIAFLTPAQRTVTFILTLQQKSTL